MDDIDDLIDELESTTNGNRIECLKNSVGVLNKGDTDVDIEELLSPDYELTFVSDSSKSTVSCPLKPPSTKLLRVNLGGTKVPIGKCTLKEERACDVLKCIECDHQVVYFDNYSWNRDPEYIYLRNNYPEFSRLSSKLKKKKAQFVCLKHTSSSFIVLERVLKDKVTIMRFSLGTRAYCCQCKFAEASELIPLKRYTQLRWVCTKHS